jgi:hypothetical protein
MQATMDRKWAVHYFEITRRPWHTPVKRARNCAFFAKGTPGPYSIWGTNDTHAYLHYSLILFVTGGLIYLFNLNHAAFYAVVWVVGYMAKSYTSATVKVFFEPHKLSHTPFSRLALRIYLGISYVVFQVCSYIPPLHCVSDNTRKRYYDLSNRYSEGILRGKRKTADEFTSKRSSEIDVLILRRILLTLDEDHALENFFDAIPGFCKSKLSVMPLSSLVRTKLRPALDGFLDRTLLSSLVSESVRAKRLITCLNAAHAAFGPSLASRILGDIVNGRWIEALRSVEIGHALILWRHNRDHDLNVRRIVACIIAYAQRRDDRWTMLVKEAFGVPDGVLQDSLAHGDSVLLSILIHISRQANSSGSWTSGILSSLSKFDIRKTLPRLQDDFRTLWLEIYHGERNRGSSSTSARILSEIRHLHFDLLPDTDPDLIVFMCSSTVPSLTQPDQLPAASPSHSCPIESDHTPDGSTTSQQVEEADVIAEPPSSTNYNPYPSHTRGFTSPPLATDSAHIDRVASHSVPESTGTAVACDPDLVIPCETTHDPDQSAPSVRAEIAATNCVQSDDSTPQLHSSEMEDISQAPVPSSLFQLSDRVPATISPSTGPDPGHGPDALQGTTLSAVLSHPLQGNKQDTVAPCAASDIREIPSMVNPVFRTIPTVAPDSSPILPPDLSSGLTIAEAPSFVESAPIQRDHISHALRFPSSSLITTANSHDTHDLNPPIPIITVLLHSDQMAPPHDIVAANLQPED